MKKHVRHFAVHKTFRIMKFINEKITVLSKRELAKESKNKIP